MTNRVQRHSKRLSYLLRHHPEQAGLVLDSQGWASVPEVLQATKMSVRDLRDAVEQNDKDRFEWDRVTDRIRARQGHSYPVELGLVPVEPPAVLYHGTIRDVLPQIFASGLLPMTRQHVHLSSSMETARNVAGRRGRGESVLLVVAALDLVEEGYSVFCSSNGVFLTDEVPPRFIQERDWPGESSESSHL